MTKVFDKRQIYYYILDCTKSGGIFVISLIQVCEEDEYVIICVGKNTDYYESDVQNHAILRVLYVT